MPYTMPVPQRLIIGYEFTFNSEGMGNQIAQHIVGHAAVSKQLAPGEFAFQVPLTLTNVIVGSRVKITEQDGTVLFNQVAGSPSLSFQIPYYGTPRNLLLSVRKATSAPFYQPYETQVSINNAGGSNFVSQLRDDL